ncbi:ArnT family glycosyltransferase [Nocardia spumae]|uniref:ArnT family glycosyltransferase n=1 Tax=Nocardia spumae TaxID=2887190 RepID=UPI001D134D3D|nr:glycosyltransferase family 39 protein [Nocardia spumae]
MKSASRWLFCGTTLIYVAAGLYLAFVPGFFLGDSLSRVATARSVMFSRNPHLAAIGFIFTPLTAVTQLPVVYFSQWWTVVTERGVSAVLMSAPFMAGAVVQIYLLGRDRGLPSWLVWVATAAFALDPMVVFYAANGMSEAPFLFLVIWAARRLIRWCHTDDVHDLCLAGCAFGIAYLARYDSLAAAGAATLFVMGVTVFRSNRRTRRGRIVEALLDGVIIAMPSAVAFLGWAFASWIITGQAFQQLSSGYGNASILAQSGGGASTPLYGLAFSLAEIVVMGPFLPVLIPVVAVLAWQRRDLEVVAAAVVFGAIMIFAIRNYMTGSTFPFLRFYFAALPWMVILIYQVYPARGQQRARRPGRYRRIRVSGTERRGPVLATVTVLILVTTPIVTGALMTSPTLSDQQYALEAIVHPEPENTSPEHLRELHIIASFSTERHLARYIDSLHLPDSSVLMDTVYGFSVYTATTRPQTFVIPSDQDFVDILNNPSGSGIRYILSVPNAGRGASDAINRRFPTLYDTGAEIASLELEVPNDGDDLPTWRLYRVTG